MLKWEFILLKWLYVLLIQVQYLIDNILMQCNLIILIIIIIKQIQEQYLF